MFFSLITIVVCILGLVYVIYYNSFQRYLIKINEVEGKIDTTLRERFDQLRKAAGFIKEHVDEEVMIELKDIKDSELSSFELERILVSITREFSNLKFKYRELVKLDSFTQMDFSLRENEAELNGYTAYYNDTISNFNKLVRMFPSNIIAKTARFKERTFYDGKDMNDKKTDDFKL